MKNSNYYRAKGIILRTIKLGEADRILTICTKERGKVRAVAKGVRKTKSKFGGRLEPTSHIALQCYEGRGELDIITQAETLHSFRNIREDFERVRRSMAMLEAVDNIVQDGEPSPGIYNMLVRALQQLDESSSPLIVGAFFWKLLALDGMRPMLDACALCGSTATHQLRSFKLHEGGVMCTNCNHGGQLTPEALTLVRRTLGGDLAGVLKEPVTSASFEYELLADEAMESHLERRLRSRHMLLATS